MVSDWGCPAELLLLCFQTLIFLSSFQIGGTAAPIAGKGSTEEKHTRLQSLFKAQTSVWDKRNKILDIHAEWAQKTVFEQWVLSWNSYLRISLKNFRETVAFFCSKSTGKLYENWTILPDEKGLIFSGLAWLMRKSLDSQIWLKIVR